MTLGTLDYDGFAPYPWYSQSGWLSLFAFGKSRHIWLAQMVLHSALVVLSTLVARSYVLVLSDLLARFHNIGQFGGAM